MSDVARVTEISARSPNSFEDAIKVGVERATWSLSTRSTCLSRSCSSRDPDSCLPWQRD